MNNDQAEWIQCIKLIIEMSDLIACDWGHSLVGTVNYSGYSTTPLCSCFRSLTVLLVSCTQSTKCLLLEVPSWCAVDRFFLPDALQPLGPWFHYRFSFFFWWKVNTKTDLWGKDFKSTEVQYTMLKIERKELIITIVLYTLSQITKQRKWGEEAFKNHEIDAPE